MRKFCLFWAGLCVVAGIATACGEADTTEEFAGPAPMTEPSTPSATASDPPAAGAPAGGAPSITIVPMVFPRPITVAPGAQVKIVNTDTLKHSVTSDTAGLFDVTVDGGKEATLTAPTQPGEYTYYCMFHPYMRGTLLVK